jgi:tRNA pseudouridine13 synthase
VAFTLPPGSYATLVVKRLFHRTAREDTPEEIQASARSARPGVHEADTRPPDTRSARPPRRPEVDAPRRGASRPEPDPGRSRAPARSDPSQAAEPGKARSLTPGPGFRALAKREKRRRSPTGRVRSCGRVPRLREGAAPVPDHAAQSSRAGAMAQRVRAYGLT